MTEQMAHGLLSLRRFSVSNEYTDAFDIYPVEMQEAIAKKRGKTLEEYLAERQAFQNMASDEVHTMMKNSEFPADWSEERKARHKSKFSSPSTSIVTNEDGSRTVYQAPSNDDPEGKWEIYTLEEKTDAQQFEELFGD